MSQHMDALARANEFRIAVAERKRRVAAAERRRGCAAVAQIAREHVAETLPAYMGSAKVADMLAWPKHVGPVVARDVARTAPRLTGSGGLRVRDLTKREALVIAVHYERLANGANAPQEGDA